MRKRITLLWRLLANNGFFACHIDDSESSYLKVLLDEIFGRSNYETTLYIRVRYADKTLKQDMNYHKEIEQIHIYRKEHGALPNFDYEVVGHEKFKYYVKEFENGSIINLGGKKVEIFEPHQYEIIEGAGSEDGLKEIWASGTILDGNSSGRFFRDYLTGRYEIDGLGAMYKVWDIGDDKFEYRYFTGPKRKGATKGKYYQGVPTSKLAEGEITKKVAINNFYDMAGNFGNCRSEGGVGFRGGKKPEVLLKLILEHFSNPGDLVLDSFLGSGTTAAVAHKMNRRWIAIEMGDHAYTHCKVRLDKVIDGSDQGGISKSVEWQGGGGYRFYELAPTLINEDVFGELVINKEYSVDMLASAVALHEGYIYEPSNELFWKQSRGNEKSFLFVTTRFVDQNYLARIQETMQDDEFLIIACKSYDSACEYQFKNIKIKKIPNMLLSKCKFGKDNYNLNIVNPPVYEDEEEDDEE